MKKISCYTFKLISLFLASRIITYLFHAIYNSFVSFEYEIEKIMLKVEKRDHILLSVNFLLKRNLLIV